jgi:hypothetical protein
MGIRWRRGVRVESEGQSMFRASELTQSRLKSEPESQTPQRCIARGARGAPEVDQGVSKECSDTRPSTTISRVPPGAGWAGKGLVSGVVKQTITAGRSM